MASRLLTVKPVSVVLMVAALKCSQAGKMKVQRLGQACVSSYIGASRRKDGCELLNRGPRGDRLCQREDYPRAFIGCPGIKSFKSRTSAALLSRGMHSASKRSEHQARHFSTISSRVTTASHPLVTKAYQELLRALTDIDPHEPGLQEVLNVFLQAAEYNLPGGKRIRLLSLVRTYELLAEDSAPHLELVCLLGWCLELLESSYLVLDDIMDRSMMRRGRPSWCTVPGVGLRAVNDAFFFEKAMLWVIRRRLGHLPCYLALLELFHDCDLRTILGQGLDMLSEKITLDQLDADRFWTIVTYKAGFSSFFFTVKAGMLLAGVEDPVLHAQAEKAALQLGRVCQVRNDFLDAFGDPETMGKVGMDIVDGKCTWLAVKAAQLASPAQRAVLEANLGKGVPGGPEEAAVKALYEELDLRGHFAEYEKNGLAEFDSQIRDMPAGLATAFRFMKDAVSGRDK